MHGCYLDHAATTPVRAEAVAAITACLADDFGNPASLHQAGQRARRVVERARQALAERLGAEPEEVLFTSGGTESDNLALRGVLAAARGRRHVVTTRIEHSAVLNCCEGLAAEGVEVTRIPVAPDGAVRAEAVLAALRPDTALVSIMLANNETGVLQPVRELALALRERGVPLHTDAVQALGKMPLRVEELGVDLMTLSAHKAGGPKGAGALYVRRGVRMAALLRGGHQERDLRAGTENVPGIAGFGAAVEAAGREMEAWPRRLAAMRDRLEEAIMAGIPGVVVNGARAPRLPQISNIAFPGIEGETLLLALDVQGISVSTGSACRSGAPEGSHVLQAMGVDAALARGSVRFSLGIGNDADQVERAAKVVVETARRLRR
jgi:cysteine desulfurase